MATSLGERVTVKIDGEELSDLYGRMTLEIDLDDELAATCHLVLPLSQTTDGAWDLLDDERFQVWKQIAIQIGFDGELSDVFTGYITQLQPLLPADPNACRLELWALDPSVLLDREDKRKDWPDKKDSDIAREIFQSYGLTAEVDETEVTHDSEVSTTMQCETDMQFLRRLALRNRFECFVEGTTGFFRAPALDGEPQPVLAAHFGDDTNLNDISFEVNALAPAKVAMTQIDHATKEILEVTIESSEVRALGQLGSAALLRSGVSAAQIQVARAVTTGMPEMTALCQALFQRGEWFVTATGEVAANDYGHVLAPRANVTLKGVGEMYSGVYYVCRVGHRVSAGEYTQQFRAVRNGLRPTGSEDFGGAGGLL
ncbi:MAG TPA: contractile injection system protein, VgrG/Pvc8 family [Kofleriaceae bacterium]|nr:contractile injection system protein, VgrG/Pvc8 family [Kofleriaceae bacterium]